MKPKTENTEKKPLRVGLAGAGFAATFHLECLRRVYGTPIVVVGVVSRRAKSTKVFAEAHGVRPFESLETMLPEIDLLDICSPPFAHADAILTASRAGCGVFCEKPLTGYFGLPGESADFRGDRVPKAPVLDTVVDRLEQIAAAVRDSGIFFGYGENFVYAPSVQKEREIIEKSGAQILRMTGEESHNGSHSPVYGFWRTAGGGSLMGKGCHPLTGMLYLKRVEGLARDGRPIRPRSVSARTHQLTRLPRYRDAGFIRTDYHDIEDYGFMHVTFDDGTVADALTSEVVLGGMYDFIEVFANNHRTRCHISPTGLVDTYNPCDAQYHDIYLVEKLSSREGWSPAAPDENFTVGYQAELQDFIDCAGRGQQPQSGLELAIDTTATIYAAYLSDERTGAEVEIPRINASI